MSTPPAMICRKCQLGPGPIEAPWDSCSEGGACEPVINSAFHGVNRYQQMEDQAASQQLQFFQQMCDEYQSQAQQQCQGAGLAQQEQQQFWPQVSSFKLQDEVLKDAVKLADAVMDRDPIDALDAILKSVESMADDSAFKEGLEAGIGLAREAVRRRLR